jgi:hypothetical protein
MTMLWSWFGNARVSDSNTPSRLVSALKPVICDPRVTAAAG